MKRKFYRYGDKVFGARIEISVREQAQSESSVVVTLLNNYAIRQNMSVSDHPLSLALQMRGAILPMKTHK